MKKENTRIKRNIRVNCVGLGILRSEGSESHRIGLNLDKFANIQGSDQRTSYLVA